MALVSIMCSTASSLRADYSHENVAVVSVMRSVMRPTTMPIMNGVVFL